MKPTRESVDALNDLVTTLVSTATTVVDTAQEIVAKADDYVTKGSKFLARLQDNAERLLDEDAPVENKEPTRAEKIQTVADYYGYDLDAVRGMQDYSLDYLYRLILRNTATGKSDTWAKSTDEVREDKNKGWRGDGINRPYNRFDF